MPPKGVMIMGCRIRTPSQRVGLSSIAQSVADCRLHVGEIQADYVKVADFSKKIASANDPALSRELRHRAWQRWKKHIARPGQSNVNLSVAKRFPISESENAEFHAAVFNVFNHPNKNKPISDIRTGQCCRCFDWEGGIPSIPRVEHGNSAVLRFLHRSIRVC